MLNRPMLLSTVGALVMGVAMPALAGTYSVDHDPHSLNEVSFTSRAALVKFTGRTSQIVGAMMGDPGALAHVRGEFKVSLGALDTGIGLRNEHMKNFLEVSKYPFAILKVHGLKGANRLKPNAPTSLTVLGDLTIHGVTRPVSFPAQVTYLPQQDANFRAGEWLQVSSEFPLKMSDYGIALPTMILGPKVSDLLTISLDTSVRAKGTGHASAGSNPCNPCNPCAMKK